MRTRSMGACARDACGARLAAASGAGRGVVVESARTTAGRRPFSGRAQDAASGTLFRAQRQPGEWPSCAACRPRPGSPRPAGSALSGSSAPGASLCAPQAAQVWARPKSAAPSMISRTPPRRRTRGPRRRTSRQRAMPCRPPAGTGRCAAPARVVRARATASASPRCGRRGRTPAGGARLRGSTGGLGGGALQGGGGGDRSPLRVEQPGPRPWSGHSADPPRPPPSSSRRPCAHRTRNVPDPHDGPRPPPPPPAAALAPPRSPGAEHAAAGRRKSPRPRGARLAKWVENARDRGRRPATAAGRIGEPLGPAFRHEAGDFLAVLGILRHMPSPGAQNRRIIPAAGVFLARGPAGAHPDPDVGKCLYCAPAPSKQCKNSTLR